MKGREIVAGTTDGCLSVCVHEQVGFRSLTVPSLLSAGLKKMVSVPVQRNGYVTVANR
jgi:hypothetical protein